MLRRRYKFKEKANTEKALVGLVDDLDKLSKLIGLIQNVCLLRDDSDSRAFYPRINMDQTESFKMLNPGWREVLERLYHSYYFERQEELWQVKRQKAVKKIDRNPSFLTPLNICQY